jgi:hypothetical protein
MKLRRGKPFFVLSFDSPIHETATALNYFDFCNDNNPLYWDFCNVFFAPFIRIRLRDVNNYHDQ